MKSGCRIEQPTRGEVVPTKRGAIYLSAESGAESSPQQERVCRQREGCLTSVKSGCRVEPMSREGVPTNIGMSCLSVGVESRAHREGCHTSVSGCGVEPTRR